MTSDHQQQGGQKRSGPPDFEEGFVHRLMPTAFQNATMKEVAQGVEELWPVSRSESQNYNLSQSPIGSHRSLSYHAPGEFNNRDDVLIRTAVTSDTPFSHMEAFLFTKRTDISIKSFKSRAHEIKALRGKEEDERLGCLMVKGNESDPGFLSHQLAEQLVSMATRSHS